MTIAITAWNNKTRSWKQITAKRPAKKVKYVISHLAPDAQYTVTSNKTTLESARSDSNGDLILQCQLSGAADIRIVKANPDR